MVGYRIQIHVLSILHNAADGPIYGLSTVGCKRQVKVTMGLRSLPFPANSSRDGAG